MQMQRWLAGALRLPAVCPYRVLAVCLALLALAGPGLARLDYDVAAEYETPPVGADTADARSTAARYGLREFVVVAATPPDELLAAATLTRLAQVVDELSAVAGVTAVVSLLDVPLVRNVDGPLTALAENYRTLRRDDVDLRRAWNELTTSPLYRDTLVTPNGRTTVLQVFLAPAGPAPSLATRLANAVVEACPRCAPPLANLRLPGTEALRDRPATIAAIAAIVARHRDALRLRLAGGPAEAEALALALARDLLRGALGGMALIAFIGSLWVRDWRGLFVVGTTTLASVALTLGLAGWSGFAFSTVSVAVVPLALAASALLHGRALCLAIALRPGASAPGAGDGPRGLAPGACGAAVAGLALVPVSYGGLAGFGALLTLASLCALALASAMLPALVTLCRPAQPRAIPAVFRSVPATPWRWALLAASAVALVGLTMSPTPQRMDRLLPVADSRVVAAGRLPGSGLELDVLLAFPPAPTLPADDADDALLAEIESDNAAADNWFTPQKLDRIKAVHDALDALPESGAVRSLASALRVAEQINGGVEFNAYELNLIYKRIPRAVRSAVVEPYVAVAADEARIAARFPAGRIAPDTLLQHVKTVLERDLGLRAADYRLRGELVGVAQTHAGRPRTFALTMIAAVLLQAAVLLVARRDRRASARGGLATLIAVLGPGLAGVGLALGLAGWAGLPSGPMILAACAGALALTMVPVADGEQWSAPHPSDYADSLPAALAPLLAGIACLPLLSTRVAALVDFYVVLALAVVGAGVFRVAFAGSRAA